jgi:hypothetical protein
MSWLDLSNVSNIFRQSYVNGFLDVSRNIIGRGDVSFNQRLIVGGKTILSDASINNNLIIGGNTTINGSITLPPASIADSALSSNIVTKDASQVLTNKTLTSPEITTISNMGTLTLPFGDKTIATLDGSETFTNKTITTTGLLTASAGLLVYGNVTMNDNLLIEKDISLNGNMSINGDIIPSIGNTFNLGSQEKPFKSLFINTNTLFFTNDNTNASISFNQNTGGIDISNNGNTSTSVVSYNGMVPIGKTIANAFLDVSGSAIFSSTVSIVGDVSMNRNLFVTNDHTNQEEKANKI